MKFEDSKLYGATEEVLLNYLAFIDNKTDSIGIIGHQPGLKQLAMSLIISFSEGMAVDLNKNFSTGQWLERLQLKRWDQISNRSGILIDYYDSKK